MKFKFVLLISAFVIGSIMISVSYTMIKDGGFYIPRLFKGGIFLCIVSIIFLFVPNRLFESMASKDFEDIWKETSKSFKLLLIFFFILGIIMASYLSQILIKTI